MSDKDFLTWVYDRMCNKYGENPNYDYMLKMKAIIDKMDGVEKAENDLEQIRINGDC